MHLENVLSLFDGISCGQVAIERAGHTVGTYIASEIDKYAIQVTQKNYPNTKQVGKVEKIKITGSRNYPLLWGGGPCQGFSYLGDELNFLDPRSALVFEFVRIKNEMQTKGVLGKFVFENVMMRQEYRDVISRLLGVEPIEINSSLVSAQLRRRLYWTNIEGITQPSDKGLCIRDILETEGTPGVINHGEFIPRSDNKATCVDHNYWKGPYNHGQRTLVYMDDEQIERAKIKHAGRRFKTGKKNGPVPFPTRINGKAKCLLLTHPIGARVTNHIDDGYGIRKLTPLECERLQTLPDNYTAGVSDTQRYKGIGNGWTVDVITHILSHIK